MMMRINMRDQLCGFVVLTTLCALGILTVVTWSYDRNLVVDLRSSRLEVIASLKAKQLQQSLLVYTSAVTALATRQGIVSALKNDINLGKNDSTTVSSWANASSSLGIVLGSYDNIVYVTTQNADLTETRMNITSVDGKDLFPNHQGDVELQDTLGQLTAYNSIEGTPSQIVPLIPASLNNQQANSVPTSAITDQGLFLGPVIVYNDTLPVYLASMTMPMYNNTTITGNMRTTLGYLTIVFDLELLMDVVNDTQGLGNTGQVLVLGPDNRLNRWNILSNGHLNVTKNDEFKFVLPPVKDPSLGLTSARASSYRQALRGWRQSTITTTTSGSDMNTHNDRGQHVTVGYATIQFAPTNSSWLLISEQDYSETLQPINELRNIAVGTVFGVAGLVLLITFPLAHYAVTPIRRLREATKRGGRPPEYTEQPKLPFWTVLANKIRRRPQNMHRNDQEMDVVSVIGSRTSSERRYAFHIPQKVEDRKRLINDELSDLTVTFNAMTEELVVQYENLEEKVRQRTKDLEAQKRLAESANEAKSMFIANVSHELRTPLNGILGMCSVVMGEEDLPARSRKNLEVVFKSGELLLHLLTDLLTFSKNQVSDAMTQVKLEERVFKIKEFTTQILALFGNQAQDSGIDLSCEVHPPHGIDWEVSGDMNRILQVVINLISNSLKFTPRKGSVQLMIVMDPNEVPQDAVSGTGKPNTPDGRPSISPFRYPSEATSSTAYDQEKPARPKLVSRHSSTGIVNPNSQLNKHLMNNISHPPTPGANSVTSLGQGPSSETGLRTAFFEFRVIDTGPGVPEHLQDKIFEPFIQGDVGLSRKYGGTGLGLSICRQLATIMGGEIRLKTFENAGSTFTLRIPLKFAPSRTGATGGISTPCRQMSVHSRSSYPAGRRSLEARDSQSVNSMLSAAFTAVSVQDVANQDNIRLVGLSQPFFAPSSPDDSRPSSTPIVRPPSSEGAPVYAATPQQAARAVADAVERARTPVGSDAEGKAGVVRKGSVQKKSKKAKKEEEKATKKKKAEEEKRESERTISVLVAEDNKVNQKVVMKMLEGEGIKNVTVAEDGQQAVDRIKETLQSSSDAEPQKKYDIIFMDVQMPNVDGLQSTRMIRELGYSAPIIALTAFAEEGNVKDCFDSGMDYFLAKPLKRPQIRHVLNTYCSSIAEEPASPGAKSAKGKPPASPQKERGADKAPDEPGPA